MGRVNEYPNEPRLRDLPFRLVNIPRFLLLGIIRLYQSVVSPALPSNTCRFYPTCSHYGYQAVYKHGFQGWLDGSQAGFEMQSIQSRWIRPGSLIPHHHRNK